MPASPVNFATIDTNPTKLFGGNITEVPTTYRPVPSNYIQELWDDWDTLWPIWIKPQIRNWKLCGGNVMRVIGGLGDGNAANYTQARYETRCQQLIAECRAQGMMVSFTNGIGGFGSYPADASFLTRVRDANAGFIQRVLIPNQDIVAYYEAGQQENLTDQNSADGTNYLAAQARTVTTIPLLVSMLSPNYQPFNGNAAITLFSYHWYNGDSSLQNAINGLRTAFNTSNKPILIEEMGMSAGSHSDAQKADYLRSALTAMFGHPQCAGVMQWGLLGDTFDGDWRLLALPSGSNLDPAAVWGDTPASLLLKGWGPANRNLLLHLTATGTVTGTAANLPLALLTGNSVLPTEANAVLRTVLYKPGTGVRLRGTVNLAAASPGTYRLTLVADQNYSGGVATLGSADVASGGSQAFTIVTQTPGADDYTFRVLAQRVSGSADATIQAFDAVLDIGNAPAAAAGPAAPSANAGRVLFNAADRPILFGGRGRLTA